MPSEIAKYLYTDEEMRPVFSKMARSFNYSEVLFYYYYYHYQMLFISEFKQQQKMHETHTSTFDLLFKYSTQYIGSSFYTI